MRTPAGLVRFAALLALQDKKTAERSTAVSDDRFDSGGNGFDLPPKYDLTAKERALYGVLFVAAGGILAGIAVFLVALSFSR